MLPGHRLRRITDAGQCGRSHIARSTDQPSGDDPSIGPAKPERVHVTILPQAVIRPAGPADAPALARLRYEFRAGHDVPVEPEDDFVTRCTLWMEARLAAGGPWRCWLAEEAGRVVGTVWLQRIDRKSVV